MNYKQVRYALERAIDLMPTYESPDWKTQQDNCRCDVSLARTWLANVLNKIQTYGHQTMPTKTETDIDAKHEEGLVRMAKEKAKVLAEPIYLQQAINHSPMDKRVRFLEIISTLAKYGIEYAEPFGFDRRMTNDTAQDLIELGQLVEGIVEDYLEAEE